MYQYVVCCQKTSPRSLGWNTGRSGFSEPGCHTQLEQVAKSQRSLLDEMNNNIHDFAVRVTIRGGNMTHEPLYPEGHPKRIEQDSQRINTDASNLSKNKKEEEK